MTEHSLSHTQYSLLFTYRIRIYRISDPTKCTSGFGPYKGPDPYIQDTSSIGYKAEIVFWGKIWQCFICQGDHVSNLIENKKSKLKCEKLKAGNKYV